MGNNIDTGNYSRNNIVEVTSNNIKQSEYRAETYAQKAEKVCWSVYPVLL